MSVAKAAAGNVRSSSSSSNKRFSRIAAILIGVAALTMWLSTTMTWLRVEAYDDKSGSIDAVMNGAQWSAEAPAMAMVLGVTAVAALSLRRFGRRVVGILAVLAGAAGLIRPVTLFFYEPDTERVHRILSTAASTHKAHDPVALSSWSEVTSTHVALTGPPIAIVACVAAIVGGLLVTVRPGTDGAASTRYERRAGQRERLSQDLATAPESGRVMWDALDEDIDPTDPSAPRSSTEGPPEAKHRDP